MSFFEFFSVCYFSTGKLGTKMSGNDCSPIPDDKVMAYIYDDVDDSDIFGFGQLNNSFTENDAKVSSGLSF